MNLEEIEQYTHSYSPQEILEKALNQFFLTENEDLEVLLKRLEQEMFNELTENVQYFQDNIADIKANWDKYKWMIDLLADEKSKNTVVKMLAAKLTMNTKYIYEAYSDETLYFNQKIFGPLNQETYIDCGAYIGDSVLQFIQTCPQYEQIYAFEAMPEVVKTCSKNLAPFANTELFELAVSNKEKTIFFDSMTSTGDSRESSEGTIKVLANSLDNLIKRTVTFIKMDIEGGEKSAIEGARTIIQQQHPKMVICLYHLSDDFWKIPELIHSINPNYYFFVRQHDPAAFAETILYCVPKEKANLTFNNTIKDPKTIMENLYNAQKALYINLLEENAKLRQYVPDKHWFLQQLRHYKATVNQKINEIYKLMEDKKWLEEQWNLEKNQRLLLETKLAEIQSWTDKLQSDKNWMEKQWKNEKKCHDDMQIQYTELKNWTDELDLSKTWIEEQWIKEKEEKEEIRLVLSLKEEEISETQIEVSKYKYKLGLLINDEKIQKIIKKKKYEI